MADYISRDDVLKAIDYQHEVNNVFESEAAYVQMWETINDDMGIKSADVQPVKHGYWEEISDYGGWGDTHYRCSVCGEEWYLEDGKPKDNNMNFCPRCGAKMDAEPDEPWQSE